MSEQTKRELLSYLVKICLDQCQVRNCEVEGMIWDVESRINALVDLGLINLEDCEHLIAILNK